MKEYIEIKVSGDTILNIRNLCTGEVLPSGTRIKHEIFSNFIGEGFEIKSVVVLAEEYNRAKEVMYLLERTSKNYMINTDPLK